MKKIAKLWRRPAGLLAVALVSVGTMAPTAAYAADKLGKVLRKGYQMVLSVPYLSFDGCEYEKAYSLGKYIFICTTYEYSYQYGEVILMAKKGAPNVYLCTGDDQCFEGTLYIRN